MTDSSFANASSSALRASADKSADKPALHPRSATVQSRRISRIPAFTPVPVRARYDGWVPWRQAEFLGYLAETRSVKAAAAKVGMSRESAYRLRRRTGAEEFVAVWDMIMGNMHTSRPKVTFEGLYQRIKHGTWRPIMRGGKYVGSLQKPDSSALRSALAQADRGERGAAKRARNPEGHTKRKSRSV